MVTVGLMMSLKDPLAKKRKGKKDNGRKTQTWRKNVQYLCRREEMGKCESEGHTKKGEKNVLQRGEMNWV